MENNRKNESNKYKSLREKDAQVKRQKKLLKKQARKEKRKNIKHYKLKLALKIIGALILLGIIVIGGTFAYIFNTDKWTITREQLLSNAGATVYDKHNNVVVELTGDEVNKRITLSEMGYVPDAFVALEDKRFYEHNGIDFRRTFGAILNYFIHSNSSAGGGSTITQQLVKITMKDDERSGLAGIERKIREWSRAVKVEEILEKDEILERYLNRIYLGTNNGLEVRGVEAAANFYFNKAAKDLTIEEACFLAGINHSPGLYDPYVHESEEESAERREDIKDRTLTALYLYKEYKNLPEEEYNAAKEKVENGLVFTRGTMSNGNSSMSFHTAAAINQIANELSEKLDISYNEAREQLIGSGYKIYTTIDPPVQKAMEEVYRNPDYQVSGYSYKDDVDKSGQSGMTIIDLSNGQIVAQVGELSENPNTLGLNRALSERQAGSSFKPLATVAPGLESKTITAATKFYDVETSFGSYTVHDSDEGYYDKVLSMRELLAPSLNVPEVKLLQLMGLTKSVNFLNSVGIDATDSAGLSLALGPVGVSTVQMAAAYGAIGNGGTYYEPIYYTKVLDQNDEEVISSTQKSARVMTEQNAYIETDLLTGPIKASGGTASYYSYYLGDMDVAGKTGSSNDFIDRWFCGYTPYYAAACWYGNDNGNENEVTFAGSNPATRIWFNVMQAVHENLETKYFSRPDGIVSVTICKETGKKATDKCKDTYTEIFASDNIPGECSGHTTVKICKDTGKLATQYCTNVEEKVYSSMIDTEKNGSWSPKQKVEEPPAENCTMHTEKTAAITVPNVVGKTYTAAKAELEKAGFKVEQTQVSNTKAKYGKGYVLEQSETKAAKGKTIKLTVNMVDVSGGSGSDDNKNITNTTNTTNTTINTTTNTTNTTNKN